MTNKLSLTNPLINSGSELKLVSGSLTYSWKNLVNTDPVSSKYSITEAQTGGWENPVLVLKFMIPTSTSSLSNGSTYMNWEKWIKFCKVQYDGTSATQTTLQLVYGDSDISFASYASSSSIDGSTGILTSIPIVIKSFTTTIDNDNSQKASNIIIQATVVETT